MSVADTPSETFFWEGLEEGRLLFQKCGACGHLRYPPAFRCPDCGGLQTSIVEASGDGSLYSYTVLSKPALKGWTLPLTVGLVALDDGVRIVGPLERGLTPRVGMRLSARFGPNDLAPRPLRFVAAEAGR